VSFAAAWLAAEMKRGTRPEDLIAAACAEGVPGSGGGSVELQSAARRAWEAAAGDPAAALAALVSELGPCGGAARMAPHAPHDGWLHGPPKPACHAARVATADAVNKLRATRDGEIGACTLGGRVGRLSKTWLMKQSDGVRLNSCRPPHPRGALTPRHARSGRVHAAPAVRRV
jgi:hypothetical protein